MLFKIYQLLKKARIIFLTKLLNYFFISSYAITSPFFPRIAYRHNLDKSIDQNKLHHYLTYMHLIKGWFYKESAELFIWMDYIHKVNNVKGNLFEIGTFQGKSAILLGLLANNEKVGLCDIFRTQKDKEAVIKHINVFFKDQGFIEIYHKSSNDLLDSEFNNCRLFHIDGDHSYEQAYKDLKLASKLIIEQGIIIVDDFFNIDHPGVTEAAGKILAEDKTLSPLLIGFSKLFICKAEYYEWYINQLNKTESHKFISNSLLRIEEKEFFNHKIKTLKVKRIY